MFADRSTDSRRAAGDQNDLRHHCILFPAESTTGGRSVGKRW
jgi:hypothetical protein